MLPIWLGLMICKAMVMMNGVVTCGQEKRKNTKICATESSMSKLRNETWCWRSSQESPRQVELLKLRKFMSILVKFS